MKKRILPLLLLGLPYFYLAAFNYGISDQKNANAKMLLFLIIWVLLFLAFFIGNLIFVIMNVSRGVKSEFFLFWNMVMKLVHIPVYLLIFFIGMLFAGLPGAIIFMPFLMAFDYMLLILTSMVGIGGIVQAAREKKLTVAAAVVLGILHFVFCADVVCAVVAFCKVKLKDRKLKKMVVGC